MTAIKESMFYGRFRGLLDESPGRRMAIFLPWSVVKYSNTDGVRLWSIYSDDDMEIEGVIRFGEFVLDPTGTVVTAMSAFNVYSGKKFGSFERLDTNLLDRLLAAVPRASR